jgi:murein DD-endopeptidase MepM/ murein hydrolase activator NlpD
MIFYHLKQNNNKLKKVFSGLLIAGVLLIYSINPNAAGQTADQLAQEKQAKQQQLNAILNKIADYQREIKQKQSQASSLKNELSILSLKMAETAAQIEATDKKIDAANIEIAEVTDKIVKTQNGINQQKQILKTLVADINDLDQRSPLEIALENDNFQQFLDQVQYATSIQEQSQETLTKIKQLEADLEIRQSDLKTERANLAALLETLDIAKTGLVAQQKDKQRVLDQTRGVERTYQKLLTESERQEAELSKEIQDLDNAIAAKLGNRRLKPVHGLIAWPMDGTLTQGYGRTGFTSLGYNYHNGIDVAAAPGTPIYATADGTVINTGTGSGAYGNWVAIKHNTGKFAAHPIVSLYAHMTSFRVSPGKVLKQGDLVGFEGNTGNTTRLLYGPHRGYHLHFTIFDAEGFGVANGTYESRYGPYKVPYGATYNPLEFL